MCEQTDGVAWSYYVYSFGKQKAEQMIGCIRKNQHTIPAWHAHAEILRVCQSHHVKEECRAGVSWVDSQR